MNINFRKSEKLDKNISSDLLTQRSRFGWLPLLFLIGISWNLFMTFNLNSRVQKLIIDKPVYVQRPDGKVSKADPVDPLHREHAVIQKFSQEWLQTAFSWSNNNPDNYEVESQIKYPKEFYLASFAIDPEYRKPYMEAVAEKYSRVYKFSDYISGANQSFVRMFDAPMVEPVKGEKNVWDVTIVANRTHTANNSILNSESFNHVIRVKAILPNKEEESESTTENETEIQELMRKMQNKGLQIIKISVFNGK